MHFSLGITDLNYTMDIKTVLCKTLTLWDTRGKGKMLSVTCIINTQEFKFQNKYVQYIMYIYNVEFINHADFLFSSHCFTNYFCTDINIFMCLFCSIKIQYFINKKECYSAFVQTQLFLE